MGLWVGISNVLLQGSMGGTSSPYNDFPYSGGHIPSSSPLLGGAPQQLVWLNMDYSLFGAGSQGTSSKTMSMGYFSFSLLDAFGNNAFSSVVISVGGNPIFGQQNPVEGIIPAQGETPHKDPGIHGRDQSPRHGCRLRETTSMANGTLGKAQYLCPSDRQWATLS
jgi:hypothetical protein